MEVDDVALLAAVSDGSDRAFNLLIDRHQQALRVFLRGLIANQDDADDIAQETLVAAWTNAKSFKGQASVRSWLFAIAWRRTKDTQRGWFRRSQRESAYHELSPSEHDRQFNVEERLALNQALSLLPLEQRAVVTLCLGCGLTHTEVAEVLDMPLGTVKSNVLRGREKLRAVLGER